MPNCSICNTKLSSWGPYRCGRRDVVYWQCPSCELIVKDAKDCPTPEEEHRRYCLHRNSRTDAGYVNMLNDFITCAVSPFKACGQVLDIGCGPEPVLAGLLKEKGFSVDMFDRYFFPHTAYRKKTYDIITATEVIEHIRTPLAFIEEAAMHLRPTGIVALMTLFHPHNDRAFQSWWYRTDETHVAFFTETTCRTLAAHVGLSCAWTDGKRMIVLKKEKGKRHKGNGHKKDTAAPRKQTVNG